MPSFSPPTAEDVVPLMTGQIAPDDVSGLSSGFLPSPCVQNHAANLAFLPDGTLTCVWFGGTMEGMGDISVYMSRLRPGSNVWSVAEKLSDDPEKSEQNPLIFVHPSGAVWLLYTSQTSGNQDGAVVKRRISSDGGQTFGPPDILCDVLGTFVRQPPVVNSNGQVLIPVFRCVSEPGQRWSGNVDTAAVLVGDLSGREWQMLDLPGSLGAVHMNIVPQGQGRMLAFFRNRFAVDVLCSQSDDGGLSWTPPQSAGLPNNNSSIQAVALRDGRIAMVYNHMNSLLSQDRRLSLYDELEDGPDEAKAADPGRDGKAIWGVARAPLSLALSVEPGGLPVHALDLDRGDGYCLTNNSKDGRNREFSYPSVVEGPDGSLHIAYTYFRRAIKYVRLAPGTF